MWAGLTVCNQDEVEKIRYLQRIKGNRWLSVEPLLSRIDLKGILASYYKGVDWVCTGAETGPGARPCDPAWIQSIVDQCQVAGVPVWVKQAPGGLDRDGVKYPWPREWPKGR